MTQLVSRFVTLNLLLLTFGTCFVEAQTTPPGPQHAAQHAARTNIVLIVIDDLGYADLGCQGSADVRTPNIDALAAGGVRFTAGYVASPLCSPSRAGLLTGRYPQRFGLEFNGGMRQPGAPTFGLPTSEFTLAERLRDAGYATGLVGKWHLGHTGENRPSKHGFGEFFGFLQGWHSYVGDEPNPINTIRRGEKRVAEAEYLTDAFTREGVDFINRHANEPFFLYLAYNAVHLPQDTPPAKYMDRFGHIADGKRKTMAAMLSAVDDGVGSVMKTLRDQKLDQNTLIVLISDNGGPTKETSSSNLPFRGTKSHLLEGGIRVPFIMSWPGKIPAAVVEQTVISLDIFPTALAAAGLPIPGEPKLDGINLLPLLTGQTKQAPHEVLCWRIGSQQAVRKGNWKLWLEDNKENYRLYDLSTDPGEMSDLARVRPEVLKDMLTTYAAWEAQMIPPLWIGSKRDSD